MKMSKKYRRLCAVLGLSLICGTGMVSATSGSKTVQATFRDIKITYNGVQKTVTNEAGQVVEPFAINGTVYVPLRGVGQILGVDVGWNGPTNTVSLLGNTSSSNVVPNDVTPYVTKINELQTQLNAAQAEIATLKGSSTSSSTSSSTTTISTASLNEMANTLYSEYSDVLSSSIDFDFELTQKASRLELNISYASSTENTKFDDLSQPKIKNFIADVCDEVRNKFGDVAIQGSINYSKLDLEKVEFSVTTAGKYDYSFAIDEEDVKEYVEDVTDDSISLGDLGRKDINYVDATIKNAKITFNIYLSASSSDLTSTTDVTKNWNSIAKESLVKSQLKEIVEEIESNANGDYTIIGYIYTSDNKEIAAIDSDGDVSVSRF